jgi:GTPase involved in cell partitioning and DNA repair
MEISSAGGRQGRGEMEFVTAHVRVPQRYGTC